VSERSEVPLLLHSLTEVGELVQGALDIVRARTIVEIGSEAGGMTELLVAWARGHEATVVSVDPEPPPRVRRLEQEGAPIRVVAAPSPEALGGVQGEAWIVDGDHNYATVTAELRHVFAAVALPRLVILHDVGWPCARRDSYYAPERIAEHERHPHSRRGGIVPGEPGTAASGLSGRGRFAWAEREGGSRNGVLTAVEDIMAEVGDLRLDVIPCLFGVGFLFPAAAPWAGALEAHLAPWSGAPLLEALERNRLALYIRVIELQDALDAEQVERDRLVAALHEQIGMLESEALARRASP